MKKIIVVSINSGFRMANVGVWLGEGNVFGGFVAPGEEKQYHLRRMLVKPTTEDVSTTYVNDVLEPYDRQLTSLDVKLDIASIGGEENPWIPNTGQLKKFDKIEIMGRYIDTELDSDLEKFIEQEEIIILSPVDTYYYDTETEASSNIYKNKGDGLKFYAMHDDGNILLATFTRKTTTITEGEDFYDITYNSDIFYDDESMNRGKTKGYFLLCVEGDKLVLALENGERISKFGIRPIETNIRFGDDFNLSFALADNKLLKGKTKTSLGIYDKKMLWRANLYIKETNDWNDNNSWNAPPTTPDANNSGKPSTTEGFYSEFGFLKADKTSDPGETKWYGKNEWNKSYDGKTRLKNSANGALINEPTEVNYLRNLTDGDGTQVVAFNDFIYHPNLAGTIQRNVVSYSYGCSDSPFEFNDELRQQQLVLSDYYNINGEKFNTPRFDWKNDNTDLSHIVSLSQIPSLELYNKLIEDYSNEQNEIKVFTETNFSLVGWNSTRTPTGIWTDNNSTYIKPSTKWSDLEDTEDNAYYTSIPNELVGFTDNFPYLPGYALWYYFEYKPFNSTTHTFPDWINVISSGIDCNGFVSRSASYTSNKYKWKDNENQNLGNRTKWFTNPSYPIYGTNNDSYLIAKSLSFGETIVQNLDKINVGDIMYYGSNEHITMISDIDRSKETITLGDIKLIESTWGGTKNNGLYPWGKVSNHNTLENYSTKTWKIVRLKREE